MSGSQGYVNDPPAAVDADSTNETNDSVIALLKAIKNLQIDITELNLILAGAVSAGKVQCDTELTITGEGLATETTISDVKTAVEALAVATPDTAAGDLASISADLGTVQADIALMKADLAAILAILES
jgi:metal-sulfur cluster biosynthetic enzyme